MNASAEVSVDGGQPKGTPGRLRAVEEGVELIRRRLAQARTEQLPRHREGNPGSSSPARAARTSAPTGGDPTRLRQQPGLPHSGFAFDRERKAIPGDRRLDGRAIAANLSLPLQQRTNVPTVFPPRSRYGL